MANLIIKENGEIRTTPAVNGEELLIQAPCNCSEVNGVQINNVEFPFYDAAGKSLANITGLFAQGSLIRIMIDTLNARAYILNGAVPRLRIVEVLATLSADGWNDTAPYTQTVTINGMEADTNGMVRVNYQTATAEQRNVARKAMLCLTEQGENTITITADGELPTVNIPIVVRMDIKDA
jgi:hypothetical protein